MIVFLRNEYQDKDTVCCAIKVGHFEVFHGGGDRIEITYPEDVTQIGVEGDCYRWGELYEYCMIYENEQEYIIRDEFPLCKWFEDTE